MSWFSSAGFGEEDRVVWIGIPGPMLCPRDLALFSCLSPLTVYHLVLRPPSSHSLASAAMTAIASLQIPLTSLLNLPGKAECLFKVSSPLSPPPHLQLDVARGMT